MHDSGLWNREKVVHLLDQISAQAILQIPLTNCAEEDILYWKHEPSGCYTTKSAYLADQDSRFIQLASLSRSEWKNLWSFKIQDRLKLMPWKIIVGALPVQAKLRFWEQSHSEEFFFCNLCHYQLETSEHLFFQCPLAQILWKEAHWPLNVRVFEGLTT